MELFKKLTFGDRVHSRYFKRGIFIDKNRMGTCRIYDMDKPLQTLSGVTYATIGHIHVEWIKRGWKKPT